MRHVGSFLLLATVVAATALADDPRPADRHVETWTIDPKAGDWTMQAEPVAGTEDGDLDLARQALARDEFKKARRLVGAWIKRYGGDAPRYPEALYVQATADLSRGEYRAAHDAYQALRNDFPGSVYAEKALDGEFRIAEQYLAGKRRKAWGGMLRVHDYDAGIAILDSIIVDYSGTDLAALAIKTKADYYYRIGEYELAEDEYARLAREYTRGRYEGYALLRSALSALARFPGVKYDDAGLVEAEERFHQLEAQHPRLATTEGVPSLLEQIRSTRAEQEYETGRFYERTKHPRAAAFYYRSTIRNWPGTVWAAQADGRLTALGVAVEMPTTQPAAHSDGPGAAERSWAALTADTAGETP